MYVRIASMQLQPGKMDQLLDMYEKYWATVPQKGLLGGRQLFDRATDKLISITTWEALADLETNNRAVKQDIPRYTDVYVAPPTLEVYELGSEIEPARSAGMRAQGQTMYARVLTVQIQPDKVDEMIDDYPRYADSLQQHRGFLGARQLVDRAANKLVSITTWETMADLEASDRVYRDRAPEYTSVFLGPATREIYEVGAEVLPAREVGGA